MEQRYTITHKLGFMIKSRRLIFILIAIVVTVSGVSYFYYSSDRKEQIFSELIKEYSPLVLEDSINHYVNEINQPYLTEINNHPHQAFVILTPYKKQLIMVGLELGKEQMTLDETLRVGDYLFKRSGSNKVCIIRVNEDGDSLKFNFVITDYQGNYIKSE